MYEFKVVTTVLMVLLNLVILYVGIAGESKKVSLVMFGIIVMGICAIWG